MIALDMQPVPVTAASNGSPFAIAATRVTVRDVVDRARSPTRRRRACDAAARAIAAASSPRGDRLDTAHLGLDADERRDLACVAAQHRHVDLVEDALRRLGAVRRRAGADRVENDRHARLVRRALRRSSIASTHCGESVPMFSTSAPARRTISATSSRACAITGSAPSARVAFAVSFMTT